MTILIAMMITVAVALAILIAILLGVLFSIGGSEKKNQNPEIFTGVNEKQSPCPICGTMLKRGERVHSVVYPGKNDRLVEIFGCPYCYPERTTVPRYCPACKKELAVGAIVYARMFTRGEKPHVHINGCPECMKKQFK